MCLMWSELGLICFVVLVFKCRMKTLRHPTAQLFVGLPRGFW
jgi:hypothetical protein